MTALVTGAAGGIGRAGFLALRAAGEDVIGQDLLPTASTGLDLDGDMREAHVLDEIERAANTCDSLTTVVAAHGVEGPGSLHEIDPKYAHDIMAINFETVANLWERVRPALEKSSGSFVVIASQAAVVSEKGNALYCASKAALAGLLRGVECETNVRLRLLHPGGIGTPLLMRALQGMAANAKTPYDEYVEKRYSGTTAGRIADPSEVGAAIAWAATLQTPKLVELVITGGEVLW